MIYCFDIDGTLCTNTEGKYEEAEPIVEVITRVNLLYDEGHQILLQTARGSTTGIDWRPTTEQQLGEWGVKYHALYFGKPTADVYVDDKAIHISDWVAQESDVGGVGTMSAASDGKSIMQSESYLDVTYSEERAPYGPYPFKLARWLSEKVYREPGRLLDVGCGRGEYLFAFSEFGYDVAGVDISPRAATLAQGHRVEIVDLERDDMPFPEGSFDFVFSKSVIEHMHHPTALMEKACAALRPGGKAVIMTPSWAHNYWGPFYIDHTHVTPFTAPSLADAMTLSGFTSVRVFHFHQLPFLWKYPYLKPLVRLVANLPLPYRPYQPAPWPDALNKLIRFSKEVMLLAIGERPR